MCEPTLLAATGLYAAGAGVKAYSSYKGQQAANAGLEYKAQLQEKVVEITEQNAEYAREQADYIIEQAELNEDNFRRQLEQLQGNIRTGYAKAGVTVDYGSTLEVALDTAKWAEYDAIQMKNNAEKQAEGYLQQAKNLMEQADVQRGEAGLIRMGVQSPGVSAGLSLLTSGLKFGSSLALSK